ncbi:lipoprotein insertase outer membrane protein LolB [Orbus wheelerorum]|uniref:lipoprotein insertase outer membrane protein LolB n=1 Tax=Orbus wheelerorum TaxID=3074111 RepID=UPI00370D8C94
MHLLVKFYNIIVLFLIVTLITACSNTGLGLNQKSQQTANEKHQQQLSNLTAYQAIGSLSYVTDRSKYYGRFFINQISDNQYQLKLTTPVGTSIFSLTVTPYLAELTDRDGKKYTDENVERLMTKLTGMNIPFKSLHNWFKGMSNNLATDKFDAQGHLIKTTLPQDDQKWLLTINKYNSYPLANNTIYLPASIELVNKNNKLKMTINNWKLN